MNFPDFKKASIYNETASTVATNSTQPIITADQKAKEVSMEKLKDKMLKAIKETTFEIDERLAEACARVAEEEIWKVIEEAAEVANITGEQIAFEQGGGIAYVVDKGSILKLKDKYLKSLM